MMITFEYVPKQKKLNILSLVNIIFKPLFHNPGHKWWFFSALNVLNDNDTERKKNIRQHWQRWCVYDSWAIERFDLFDYNRFLWRKKNT